MLISDIKELFPISRHRTAAILRSIDKFINPVIPAGIDTFQCPFFITDTNHQRTTISIRKRRNMWCQVSHLDLTRLPVEIFIFTFRLHILQSEQRIDF